VSEISVSSVDCRRIVDNTGIHWFLRGTVVQLYVWLRGATRDLAEWRRRRDGASRSSCWETVWWRHDRGVTHYSCRA